MTPNRLLVHSDREDLSWSGESGHWPKNVFRSTRAAARAEEQSLAEATLTVWSWRSETVNHRRRESDLTRSVGSSSSIRMLALLTEKHGAPGE